MRSSVLAVRAKSILTLGGEAPARGEDLFAPLKKIDNAVLVVRDGLVEDVRPWGREALPAGAQVHDVGPVSLIPACINAHTHLELSHFAGRTRWGQGFAAWLLSLIPLLSEEPDEAATAALEAACADIVGAGTVHVGDFCGRRLVETAQACQAVGLGATHFCEWFGFAPPFADALRPWPPRVRDDVAILGQSGPSGTSDVNDTNGLHGPAGTSLHGSTGTNRLNDQNGPIGMACAPAGHALYSTAPEVLQDARRHCVAGNKIFSFHLAESPEETELLTTGGGSFRTCYGAVLPKNWTPPGLSPFDYALSLDLLGPGTLAVHGVHLDARERVGLAASGTALCLCPRSNQNLAVGQAPVHALFETGMLLCLGTDGLTSNTDTDVRREAVYLRETLDVPPEALVRLLTVNGAAALGLGQAGRLTPGAEAQFCILPEALEY